MDGGGKDTVRQETSQGKNTSVNEVIRICSKEDERTQGHRNNKAHEGTGVGTPLIWSLRVYVLRTDNTDMGCLQLVRIANHNPNGKP